MNYIGNSFFHCDYKKMRVLVLVPHQDDEINIAGSFIYTLSKCNAEVFLVYTTNGDWKYDASIRMKEAINAASVLGINKNHLIFLGYGDAINNKNKDHIFYSGTIPVCTKAGYRETYGTKYFDDYSFIRRGYHNKYTKENYLKDLIEVIQDIKANFIICTDCDEHPDHRMLSLVFDEAMGIVLKSNRDYRPIIFKSFAYALAFTAISDFNVRNNPETKRPMINLTGKYQWDIIDRYIYQWEKRIRIPIPNEFRIDKIKKNYFTKALMQHKTQHIVIRAKGIINSDEVFWERRTDNLVLAANICASSGDVRPISDFMYYDMLDIDSEVPSLTDKYYWKPLDNDIEKRIHICWDEAVSISKIVIYGAISDTSGIDSLSVELSDGYSQIIDEISSRGIPKVIEVDNHNGITFCDVCILSSHGDNFGISECEIFSEGIQGIINPFCKIMVGDNFVYDYFINKTQEILELDCYCFGEVGNISLYVTEGKAEFNGGKLIIDKDEKKVVVEARNKSGLVYDSIIISRIDEKVNRRFKRVEASNNRFLQYQILNQKVCNMMYILKHDGLLAVGRRFYKNIILPRLK